MGNGNAADCYTTVPAELLKPWIWVLSLDKVLVKSYTPGTVFIGLLNG